MEEMASIQELFLVPKFSVAKDMSHIDIFQSDSHVGERGRTGPTYCWVCEPPLLITMMPPIRGLSCLLKKCKLTHRPMGSSPAAGTQQSLRQCSAIFVCTTAVVVPVVMSSLPHLAEKLSRDEVLFFALSGNTRRKNNSF